MDVGWAVTEPAPGIFVLLLVWGVGGALLASLLTIAYRSWNQADWLQEQVEIQTASLQVSEERYRNLFQHATEGIFLTDSSGHYLDANPAGIGLLGYALDELRQLTVQELAAPHELPQNPLRLDKLDMDRVVLNERSLIHKDGHLIPLEIGASILPDGTLLAIVRDLTARRQAEAALRESETRYRSLVAALSEGIILQCADGEIITYNRSAENILGLPVDQIMGRASLDPRWRAIHEDGSDFPGETHPAMHTLATGEAQRDIIMGVHKASGELTWILINSEPIWSLEDTDDGRLGAVVVSFVDITERKQAQAAQERYTERLRILHEIDQAILSAQSPRIICDATLKRLRSVIDCDWMTIALLDQNTDEWQLFSNADEAASEWNLGERSTARTPFSQALRAGRTVLTQDARLLSEPINPAH